MFSLINDVVNPIGALLLAPIAVLPGWLSNTIISGIMGVVLLILFKHTSNQAAIGRIRNHIRANLLALRLFRDQPGVMLRAQGRVFLAAVRLMGHSVFPLLVMVIPVALVLAQMAAWYQFRPLQVGETAIVTLAINERASSPMPDPIIDALTGAKVMVGPVRIDNMREVRWKLRAINEGRHQILFKVADQIFSKQLVIGEGFRRVSPIRPGWQWYPIILYPLESPFPRDTIVRSIRIDYPDRAGLVSGANWWVIYFFVVSMAFALLFKPIFKVKI